MKTVKHLFLFIAASAFLFSCGNVADKVEDKLNEAVEEMEEAIEEGIEEVTSVEMTSLDMTDMGIPVTLDVPEGTEISDGILHATEGDFIYYDYELTFGKYVINITMDPAGMYETEEEMMESSKDIYLDDDTEVIEEFENGYIYKTDYDGTEDYSFYYLLVKDDMAIEFNTGLTFEFYSKEDVDRMLKSVKSVK